MDMKMDIEKARCHALIFSVDNYCISFLLITVAIAFCLQLAFAAWRCKLLTRVVSRHICPYALSPQLSR